MRYYIWPCITTMLCWLVMTIGGYGVGQFSSDLAMALVLIINKDILGLVKLKRALFNRNQLHAMAKK
ncbi:hypothetical protein [uncultured Pseudoalteromonas sp.]|uniref:hypothetical protein n=1 Tax=uncultured Pseudoalteromonas sp. TaxID=114053 RepID=UPI0030C8A124